MGDLREALGVQLTARRDALKKWKRLIPVGRKLTERILKSHKSA
jgi:hypothetical protein